MQPDQIAAYSTALVAVIGAITALVVALRGIMTELKKNTAAAVTAAEVGQDTHDIVNSQRDAAIAQQTRTDNALRAAGIDIPHNPAVAEQVEGTEGTTHGKPA